MNGGARPLRRGPENASWLVKRSSKPGGTSKRLLIASRTQWYFSADKLWSWQIFAQNFVSPIGEYWPYMRGAPGP
jgi:hypothetical protein